MSSSSSSQCSPAPFPLIVHRARSSGEAFSSRGKKHKGTRSTRPSVRCTHIVAVSNSICFASELLIKVVPPCLQEQLPVIGSDAQQFAQLGCPNSARCSERNLRMEPELGCRTSVSHMHMRGVRAAGPHSKRRRIRFLFSAVGLAWQAPAGGTPCYCAIYRALLRWISGTTALAAEGWLRRWRG